MTYIQCAKTDGDHPMKEHVDKLTDNNKLTSHAFYSVGGGGDSLKNTKVSNQINKKLTLHT